MEYVADDGEGVQVDIEPSQMKMYKNGGYKIFKLVPVEVEDIDAEIKIAEDDEIHDIEED